ncbi:hypothetical protein DFQ27_000112, partial [Actinomortierella ambigua]
ALTAGPEILTLDSTQLQKLLAMDEFRVPELGVWTLVIRWAWHQHLESEGKPLSLKTPASLGRLLVKTLDGGDTEDSVDSEPGEKKSSIMIPPGLAGAFDGENEQDYVMEMSAAAHQRLQATIAPLLSSVRFHTMEIDQFHRLVEYTCLVPRDLCLQVYRHNTLAIKVPGHLDAPPRIHTSLLLDANEWWSVLKLIPTSSTRALALTSGSSTSPRPRYASAFGPPLPPVASSYINFRITCGPAFGAGPDLLITSDGKDSSARCKSYTNLNLSEVLGSAVFDVVDYEVFQILF